MTLRFGQGVPDGSPEGLPVADAQSQLLVFDETHQSDTHRLSQLDFNKLTLAINMVECLGRVEEIKTLPPRTERPLLEDAYRRTSVAGNMRIMRPNLILIRLSVT